jgi:drug/metabolite transporter (DMT)-like permease
MLLGGNGGVCWAELHVPSGLASIFIGTVPLWAALFDWIRPRGRRPTAAVAAGLLIGFAGVALLTAGRGSGPALHLTGSAVLLFAAASWAAGSIAARQLPLPESPFLATAAEMLAGGALLLAAGAVTGEWRSLDPGGVTPASLAAAAYLVVFGSLAGFTAFVWLLRVTTPAVATSYAYVNPLVALFLGWVFLGEELTARTGVAAAVILAAVALITMGSVARATAEEKYRDARQAGEQAERSNARADDRGRDRLPD